MIVHTPFLHVAHHNFLPMIANNTKIREFLAKKEPAKTHPLGRVDLGHNTGGATRKVMGIEMKMGKEMETEMGIGT